MCLEVVLLVVCVGVSVEGAGDATADKQFIMEVSEGILGRPMHLGMMYDKRTDKILMGANLINEKELPPKCELRAEPIREVIEEYTMDSSFSKTFNLLDMSGDMEGTLGMSSVVQVDFAGAFGLTRDCKQSTRTGRLIANKRIRTVEKSLDMGCLKYLATLEIFDKLKKHATHIVSSVVYGANINFVFDQEEKTGNETNSISAYVQAGISITLGMASVTASGSVNLTLDKQAEEVTKNVKVKFHGDVYLAVNPVTVESAMLILQYINKALGDSSTEEFNMEMMSRKKRQGEEEMLEARAVPVLATLTPLSELESKEAIMVREVDQRFVKQALGVFEEISLTKRMGNDVLQQATEHGFFPAKKIVYELKDMIFAYEAAMKARMAKEIELIRKMKHENKDLVNTVWRPYIQSPFKLSILGLFMSDLFKHVQILQKPCIWLLGAERAVLPAREAITIIKALVAYKYVLVYKHHEMSSDQPFIDELNRFLQNDTNEYATAEEKEEMEQQFGGRRKRRQGPGNYDYEGAGGDGEAKALDSEETEEKMGGKFEPYRRHYFNRSRSALAARLATFMNINKDNKQVGAFYFTKDDDYDKSAEKPFPSIYLYEQARLVDLDYQIPTKPRNVKCTERSHNGLNLSWDRSIEGSANVINYEIKYYLQHNEDVTMLDTVYTLDNFTVITDVNPYLEVHINITPVALPGRCKVSDVIKCWTRPSSPPGTPYLLASADNSIKIAWIAPAIIAPSAKFIYYEIQYTEVNSKSMEPMLQTQVANINERIIYANISYLTPQVAYKFRVVAKFKSDQSIEGEWSEGLYAGVPCATGWLKSFDGRTCYFLSFPWTVARQEQQAAEDCVTRGSTSSGSHLVSIHSEEEMFVVQGMCAQQEETYVPVWVGLKYDDTNKTWMWNRNKDFEEREEGRRLADSMLSHFSITSSYKSPGEKRCVYLGSDLQLHNTYCGDSSQARHFICKKRLEKPGCKKKGSRKR